MTRVNGVSPRRGGGAAAAPARSAGLGHEGSSSSGKSTATMSDGSEFDHQVARERRGLLREKVRRFARKDLVTRQRVVNRFTVDADRRRPEGRRLGDMTDQGNLSDARDVPHLEEFTAPRDHKYLGCGRYRREGANWVGIKASEGGRAGFSNLQHCGSVWSCPSCASRIMRGRADELGTALAWARREGHTVAMVTLTVRHKHSDPLDQVWDAVSHGWAKVTSGSAWVSEKPEDYQERVDRWDEQLVLAQQGLGRYPRGGRQGNRPQRRVGDQERFGVLGWARAAEVKLSRNGWHVHLHVVVVLERRGEGAEGAYQGKVAALALGHSMFGRWNAALPDEHKATEAHGYDVSVNDAAEKTLAEYLAKDGLDDSADAIRRSMDAAPRKTAMEATHGASKTHMKNTWAGITPFQLLDRLNPDEQTETAFRRDLARWYEWVDGSDGRRQLTWSKGFRVLVGLAEEGMTDQELAEQEDGGVVVITLPPATWKHFDRRSWHLLDLVERHGAHGLARELDRFEWWDDDEGCYRTGLEYGIPTGDDEEPGLFDWSTT